MKNFFEFFSSLSYAEKQEYSKACGISYVHMQTNLFGNKKEPRKETMKKLAAASNGALTYRDVLESFYGDEKEGE